MPDRQPEQSNPGPDADKPKRQPPAHATRMERFRVASGIDLNAWRTEFGASRSLFAKIRGGRDVRAGTLARLVRSARKVSGIPVQASDLYDLGDDAPLEKESSAPRRWRTQERNRTFYETALDRFLVREKIGPAALAREAGVNRQAVRHIRAGVEQPRVSTIRKLVSTLRLLTGKPVRAAELFDLGEDETAGSAGP